MKGFFEASIANVYHPDVCADVVRKNSKSSMTKTPTYVFLPFDKRYSFCC